MTRLKVGEQQARRAVQWCDKPAAGVFSGQSSVWGVANLDADCFVWSIYSWLGWVKICLI